MDQRTKGIVGAAIALVAVGTFVAWRWRAVDKQKHEVPEEPVPHLAVFLRVRDPATTHVISNTLALVEQLGEKLALDAYVLPSSGNNPTEDALARCAVDQGAAKGLRFIQCQLSVGQGNDDWSACAEAASIGKRTLDACAKGGQSQTLAMHAGDEAARREVNGTPVFLLEGKRVEGGGTREALKRAICAVMKGAPDLCMEEAAAGGLPIFVMTDSRCPDCRAPFWFRRMQMLFPEADISIVDVKTPAGRAQYDKVAPGLLPAIVLDARVESEQGFGRLQRQLVKKGDVYLMAPDTVRPEFDPTKAN